MISYRLITLKYHIYLYDIWRTNNFRLLINDRVEIDLSLKYED